MEHAKVCPHCNKPLLPEHTYCPFCCNPLIKSFPRPRVYIYRHADELMPSLAYIKNALSSTLSAVEKNLILLEKNSSRKIGFLSFSITCKSILTYMLEISHLTSNPAHSLLVASGKDVGAACELLEIPIYHCISLAEIERRIISRAKREMGEDIVTSRELLRAEDDWRCLRDMHEHAAFSMRLFPLRIWFTAQEAGTLSEMIDAHQAFLINNVEPSYPDSALLSQSYLANIKYCITQWAETKKRIVKLASLRELRK